MTQLEWIVSNDTGLSSKTMWAAINGVNKCQTWGHNVPWDVSDFGRCYRYYKNCGLTKYDLQKVKKSVPVFVPFIDNWDKLVELYEKEIHLDSMPETYNLIKKLRDQAILSKTT